MKVEDPSPFLLVNLHLPSPGSRYVSPSFIGKEAAKATVKGHHVSLSIADEHVADRDPGVLGSVVCSTSFHASGKTLRVRKASRTHWRRLAAHLCALSVEFW